MIILKLLIAGELESACVDYCFPIPPVGKCTYKSLDIKLNLQNGKTSIYEVKAGKNFIETVNYDLLAGILYSFKTFENKINQKCQKTIVVMPEISSIFLEKWLYFSIIKEQKKSTLLGDTLEIESKLCEELYLNKNILESFPQKETLLNHIAEIDFYVGPRYEKTNYSPYNRSELENQLIIVIEGLFEMLGLKDTSTIIPAWRLMSELLEIINKSVESNSNVVEKLIECILESVTSKSCVSKARFEESNLRDIYESEEERMLKSLCNIFHIDINKPNNCINL